MTRFNLSEWAITHRALVLFTILIIGAAGVYSYLNLGRAEDPSFTIKSMIVNVAWPGATTSEMQTQTEPTGSRRSSRSCRGSTASRPIRGRASRSSR